MPWDYREARSLIGLFVQKASGITDKHLHARVHANVAAMIP